MSIFDTLSDALGEAMRKRGATETSAPGTQPSSGSGFTGLLANTGFGDLSGLVQKLRGGGLEAQVASWLGAGANLPVTAEELRSALGNEQVQKITQQLGLPADRILQLLSQHLPEAVDKASPNGAIEEPEQTAH